jgi:hypothetical protein
MNAFTGGAVPAEPALQLQLVIPVGDVGVLLPPRQGELPLEVGDTLPACWPQHPHLVHEIAVLADQRRRAGHPLTSDAFQEWDRHNLPAFMAQMKSRLRKHCEDGHQPWPAKGRYTRTRRR